MEHNITTTTNRSNSGYGNGNRGPGSGSQRAHPTLATILNNFFTSSMSSTTQLADTIRAEIPQSDISQVLIDALTESLTEDPHFAEFLAPEHKNKGVPPEFITDLPRVEVSDTSKYDQCPICTNAFKDDPHPLVIKLPCKAGHLFDLECIEPWLKLNSTCPLCRVDVLDVVRERKLALQREVNKIKEEDSEDDDEDWSMYG